MAIDTEIRYASLDELSLDPQNPRLGAEKIDAKLGHEALLNTMRDWELEELAVSFIESGFWPQEALLVVKEKLRGNDALVVAEGNRRLAALHYLRLAVEGKPATPTWKEFVTGKKIDPQLFKRIPYLIAGSRKEISGYLGFRHVSGIKEWSPREKAAFIAKLIDEEKLSYQQVMRRIGSKTETVRRTYLSYRVLEQMREHDDSIDVARVEKKFSVLFLALRYQNVQDYLGFDVETKADSARAKRPIVKSHLPALIHFARWLFGHRDTDPIVGDSRLVGKLDKALASAAARRYLETAVRPDLETAYLTAGGEEGEVFANLEAAR